MQAGCKRMFGVGGNKQKSLILPLEAIFCSLVQFFFLPFCQYALSLSPYQNQLNLNV